MAGINDQKSAGVPSAVPQQGAGASGTKTKVMISVDSFLLGLRIPFDVFSKNGTEYSCILKKWTKFDDVLKTALKNKGIRFLYVEGDASQVKEFFHEKPAPGPSVPAPADNPAFHSYSRDKDEFHHVSRLVFVPGSQVNFSLFNLVDLKFKPILETISSKYVPVADAVRNVSGNLAIKMSDIKLFREYLSGLSKVPAADNKTALQARVAGVKENAKMSVRDFLADPNNAQNTTEVINSANQIINVVKKKEAALSDLLVLRAKDFHVYNHSTNVSVLATAMGVAMGFNQAQLEALGLAAMMHDVGKGGMPKEVLNKPGRLDPEEYVKWKKHVSDSVMIMQGKLSIPRDAITGVQQHHEKLSGSGYPYGLKGPQISPFGRILAIVDSYDALITPRPMRNIITPFNALEIIMKETSQKGDFDLELVKLFIKILKGQGRI